MNEPQVSGPASNPGKYGGWGIRDGLASLGSAFMSMFRGTRVERTSTDQAEVRENASKSSWSSYLKPWTWWRSSGSQKEEREVDKQPSLCEHKQAKPTKEPNYYINSTEKQYKHCVFLASVGATLKDARIHAGMESGESSRWIEASAQINLFGRSKLTLDSTALTRFFTDLAEELNQNLLTEEIRNQYQIPKDAIMVTQLTLPKSSSKEFPKTIEATVTVMNSTPTGDLRNKSNHLYVLKYSLTVAKDGTVSAPTCTLAGAPRDEGVAALYDANGNAKPIYS